MDEAAVVAAHLLAELTQGFQEQEAFDITHGTTDFGDNHVAVLVLLGQVVETLLDFVRHVRDVLHSLAQIIAAAFLLQHALEHLTTGQVVQAGKLAMNKALVVAEVKVSLGTVIQHVHFTVLVGAHGARVDVQIRVKLLHGHLKAAMLKQRADGRCGKAFTQGGNNTAGYKDIFHNSVLCVVKVRITDFPLTVEFLSIHSDFTPHFSPHKQLIMK